MQYVNLGRTGLQVSRLCLGCMTYTVDGKSWREWVLGEAASLPFLRRATEAGINFFDTANIYSNGGSEELLGRALRDCLKRDEVVIATKVHFSPDTYPNAKGNSRVAILREIDRSLTRLGTDYVDLYQIHRWDESTPIEETLEALHDVVKAGKARFIGASSMFAWQMAKALYTADQHGWTRFVSMQNHYNLIYREEEREMNPLCRDQGVGLIPWSPLARGFLAGNRNKDGSGPTARSRSDEFATKLYTSEDFVVVDRLAEVAQARGVSNSQVALAWLLGKPGVTAPIIGATKPHHLDEALAALDLTLSAEEVARLEEPYRPHPILGHT